MENKMNKKAVNFKAAFFAIVVFSLVIISTGIWVSEWNTQYDSGLTTDLAEYNKLSEMSDTSQQQKGNISATASSAITTVDFEGTSIRGAFGIISTIYSSFNVVFGSGGMLAAISVRWGLPSYIPLAILTMMVFAITFTIVLILFNRSRIR